MHKAPINADGLSQYLSALEPLQAAMVSDDTTSEEIVRSALTVIHDRASLNAIINVDENEAIKLAVDLDIQRSRGMIRGPLHGIPIVIKDNIHVAGFPCTGGTPLLRSRVADCDASVVKRLREAGAIVLGKSNMHELALGITSDNVAFGAVHNVRRHDWIAGGSSGGTAVAIASGMVTAGLGTDTGGSCRIPAALNGIVGFRPTMGRYPADGLIRISQSRDTVGPMALTVADVALIDSVLANDTTRLDQVTLSEVRIGVPRHYFFSDLEPVVATTMQETLRCLSDAGVSLIDVELPEILTLNQAVGFPLVLHEARQLLEAYLDSYFQDIKIADLVADIASPDVREVMGAVMRSDIDAEVYTKALNTHRPLLQAMYHECFRLHQLDALIFPTTPITARPIKGSRSVIELNGREAPTFPTYIRNTDPSSNAGIPGISIPANVQEEALPVGIELDGPSHSDRRLLSIAREVERVLRNVR